MASKDRVRYWRDNKLCSRCGQQVEVGKRMCTRHLLESREKERRKRIKRKQDNKCIRCGINDPREGRTQCVICSSSNKEEYNAKKMDLYYQRRSAKLCVRCGRAVKNYSVHCESCADYMKQKDVTRYHAKKNQELCVHCGQHSPVATEILCLQCKEKNQQRGSENRRKNKMTIISNYGGQCACCGETKMEFLTIDHIDGGGTQHRKSLVQSGTTIYRWIIKNNFPKGFQVLCLNCNMGRYLNGGICPHQQQVEINKSCIMCDAATNGSVLCEKCVEKSEG